MADKNYAEKMAEIKRVFYGSRPWVKCRNAYIQSKGGLCERCLAKGLIVPGEDVHHKVRLTPENIDNPDITFNFDNLELLCAKCHSEEHKAANRRGRRWQVDAAGHVSFDD